MDSATFTSTAAANGDAAILKFMLLTLIIVSVTVAAYVVPAIITNVKLYKKAGRKGWEVIVPIYGSMILADIGKKPMWMGAVLGVASILSSNRSIGVFGWLICLVFAIILLPAFAKQYDAKIGFWICWLFFPIIAVFMIKNVNYIGRSSVAAGTPAAAPEVLAGYATPQPVVQPVVTQTPQVDANQQNTPPQA